MYGTIYQNEKSELSTADNFCKQFVPRPGPTESRAWSGSKLFDTLMVFLK